MKKMDTLGPPPPRWLTRAETYGHNAPPWRAIAASKWRFVTHVPHSREYLTALRALGVRGFPYMTFYQTWINQPYQGIRMSEHPEWLVQGEDGLPFAYWEWFWEPHGKVFILDLTHPGALAWLRERIQSLTDRGVRYFKFDFIGCAADGRAKRRTVSKLLQLQIAAVRRHGQPKRTVGDADYRHRRNHRFGAHHCGG